MKDAQKPDHVSLNGLIGRLKEGRFVIPDFQRDFEWQPWDIKDLMRSIFLDYYLAQDARVELHLLPSAQLHTVMAPVSPITKVSSSQ